MSTKYGKLGRSSDAEAEAVELQVREMVRRFPGLGFEALYKKCLAEIPAWKGTKSKVYHALQRLLKDERSDIIAVTEYRPITKYYLSNKNHG